jgi:hypothetical protein
MTRSAQFVLRYKRASLGQKGFMLMELIVSIALITVIGYLSSQVLISSFRSERQLRDKTMLSDQGDFLKTWLSSKLQQADSPLPCPAGSTGCVPGNDPNMMLPAGADGNSFNSLEFMSNGICYILALDQATQVVTARQGSGANTNAACNAAQGAPSTVIANWVTNSSTNALFVFKNSVGTTLSVDTTPASQISQATTVEVIPTIDRPGDSARPFSRDISFNLGGAFVPGAPPNGSITSNKLSTSAVTATKIADSAVSGSKIQTGAVTADKLDTNSRTAYFNIPLLVGSQDTWNIPSGAWYSPANSAYYRAGVTMSDYCVVNKTLQGRAIFLIKGNAGVGLTLTGRINQMDNAGSAQTNGPFPITMGGGAAVPQGKYASITSGWATIDPGTCVAGWLASTYYYQPEMQGTQSQNFQVVSALLQLRYQ